MSNTEKNPRMWTSHIEDEELATLDVCARAIESLDLRARRRIIEYLMRRVEQAEMLWRESGGGS